MLQKEVPTNPRLQSFQPYGHLHQPYLNWHTHSQEWQQSVVVHHVTFIHRLCKSFDTKLLLMKQKSVSWLMHIDFHNNINTFSIPAEIFKVKCLCQMQSSCRRKEKEKKGNQEKKEKDLITKLTFLLELGTSCKATYYCRNENLFRV